MLQRAFDWLSTDWALKLTALALAFLLWTTVRADAPGQWEISIPVRIVNNDADWVVADPPTPSEVSITLRGPYRELLRAISERPDIIVPVDQVRDSAELFPLSANRVRMPPGTPNTVIDRIRPEMVRATFDRVTTRLIPIAAPVRGEPAPGFALAGPLEIDPAVVRASGAGRNLARIDTLRLPVIDLREHRGYDTLEVAIDTTGLGLIISPRTVRVTIPIRTLLEDTAGAPRVPPPGPAGPRQ
jgi:YbbR domain-containing protein